MSQKVTPFYFLTHNNNLIGILITLTMILAVGITNGGLAVWTLADMLPFINWPSAVAGITIPNFVAAMAFYNGLVYAYENISTGLSKTHQSKTQALCGLLPLVFFYMEVAILFLGTEWAWEKPALAILLVFPSYCLMTCRHIICSVTKMEFNWLQFNPLWFLLFFVNKYAISVMRKYIFSLFHT